MKKIFILACILLVSNVDYAFANVMGGMDAGAINSQYTRDLRLHEVASRTKQKSAIVKPKTSLNEQVFPDVVNEIKKITFVGNNAIPDSELQVVVKKLIEKPMVVENLSAIRRDVMKYYQANGYYSAVPIIVSADNRTGEIVIQIEEGNKNSIIIN
ncbi:MAG: hypothetical protein E7Z90_02295 [Cyanobacteria bacterium SIG29]|nr:hypothetical protein [Cyanobacteria bacterium SIG29]